MTKMINFLKDKLIVPVYDFFLGLFRVRWRYYLIKKCEKSGVIFDDKNSVSFNGRCYLTISKNSYVKWGGHITINSGPLYCIDTISSSKIEVYDGASLKIGEGSGMSNVSIVCTNSITIGRETGFGAGCLIMDSNFHSLDYRLRRDPVKNDSDTKSLPIVIEDNVFVGAHSIICKGVTIGARSIIAAGAVVVKSIPPDCIAGGNPCVVIKPLVLNIND